MNLSYKILVFIEHCLPETKYKFSYEKMAQAFKEIYKIPHSIATLRKEFSNLKREGFIAHKARYKKPYPILTRKGKIKIASHLPYKKYGHWDGLWRLVILSIPEKERKYRLYFQKELKNLGFQKIQNSVYISPHPLFGTINRLSSELGIRQYLILIESEKIDREKISIQKIWNIWEINREYHEFIKEAQSHFGRRRRPSRDKKFWPLKAKILEQKFYQIYQKDPHLPQELMPKDWLGNEAYGVYKEIVHSY